MCLVKPQQSEPIGSMVLLYFGNMDPINIITTFLLAFFSQHHGSVVGNGTGELHQAQLRGAAVGHETGAQREPSAAREPRKERAVQRRWGGAKKGCGRGEVDGMVLPYGGFLK